MFLCKYNHLILLPSHIMGTFIAKFKYFPIKTEKRNGIARRNWTKINVHFSKVPIKVCTRPLQKLHCYLSALISDFYLKLLSAYFFNIYYAENDLELNI